MEVTLASKDNFDGLRIGLLGGTFDPAHEGHLNVSLFAIERLKLDAVWWLVARGNPLKKTNETQAFQARLESARAGAAGHEKIVCTALEEEMKTSFTLDTLRGVKARFPKSHFVWLMGEDNLLTFHLWHAWEAIMCEVPIAVFKRSGYGPSYERCEAAQKFLNAELSVEAAESLVVARPPAWVVLDNPLNSLSSTQMRRERPNPT